MCARSVEKVLLPIPFPINNHFVACLNLFPLHIHLLESKISRRSRQLAYQDDAEYDALTVYVEMTGVHVLAGRVVVTVSVIVAVDIFETVYAG